MKTKKQKIPGQELVLIKEEPLQRERESCAHCAAGVNVFSGRVCANKKLLSPFQQKPIGFEGEIKSKQ